MPRLKDKFWVRCDFSRAIQSACQRTRKSFEARGREHFPCNKSNLTTKQEKRTKPGKSFKFIERKKRGGEIVFPRDKNDSTIINGENITSPTRIEKLNAPLTSYLLLAFASLFSDLFSSLKSLQRSVYFIIILRSINWYGFTSTTFKRKIESCDKQFPSLVESFFISWHEFSLLRPGKLFAKRINDELRRVDGTHSELSDAWKI